jgi:hypothetical protein
MSASGSVSARRAGRPRSSLRWAAIFLAVVAAGCGRDAFPEGPRPGQVQLEVDSVPASGYNHFEFCWDGSFLSGPDWGEGEQAASVAYLAVGASTVLRSEPSADLRPGTWKIGVRLGGLPTTTNDNPTVLLSVADCVDSRGNRPVINSDRLTRVVVDTSTMSCAWQPVSAAASANMGAIGAQSCPLPQASALAGRRPIGRRGPPHDVRAAGAPRVGGPAALLGLAWRPTRADNLRPAQPGVRRAH